MDRSSRHFDAISQRHPWFVNLFKIRHFSHRTFEGVLAWGLLFLLSREDQRCLIQRMADILVPGGRLLFASPAEPLVWNDAMTGLESRSLGAEEYRRQLSAVGLRVTSGYEDEGQNHYFDAFKGICRPVPVCTAEKAGH
jgi:SAM-dependent methyltransferase